MKTITLPKGTLHLNIDDLAHYMALSLWPPGYDDSPGDALDYGFCCATLKAELTQAVESKELPVRDPFTFGPHAHPYGANVQHALVRVDDLRKYVADRGLLVEVEESESHADERIPPPNETEVHSTKTRRDSITPVIELAQSTCRNPKDTAEVWAQMEALANNETPPFLASMLEGLKHLRNGKELYFTREALYRRLHPEKRATPGKRR